MTEKKNIGTDAPTIEELTHLNENESQALHKFLQQRLVECGWSNDINTLIRNTYKEGRAIGMTYEQLTSEIAPHARALVPVEVRNELTDRVRSMLFATHHAKADAAAPKTPPKVDDN